MRGRRVSVLRDVANTPFDLSKEPGFRAAVARISDDDHILLLLTHHIVSDAWSYGLIFRELNELYEAERGGTSPDLPPVGLHYGDYAAWQRETLTGDALEAGLGYWRERLADLPVLELPTEHARPWRRALPARVAASVSRASSTRTCASSRSARHDDVHGAAVGVRDGAASVQRRRTTSSSAPAVAGRTHREMEDDGRLLLAGAADARALRWRSDGEGTARPRRRNGARRRSSIRTRRSSRWCSSCRADARCRTRRSSASCSTMQDAHGRRASPRRCGHQRRWNSTRRVRSSISRCWSPSEPTDIDLTLWYRTDLFTARIRRAIPRSHAQRARVDGVESGAACVADAAADAGRAREARRRGTRRPFPKVPPATVTELFERRRRACPTASRWWRRGGVALSYGELNAGANKLARHLQSLGVARRRPRRPPPRSLGGRVGRPARRPQGGRRYVPLPPDLPAARRCSRCARAARRFVLTLAAPMQVEAPIGRRRSIALDRRCSASLDAHSRATIRDRIATPSSLAYVLFTSGSTGRAEGRRGDARERRALRARGEPSAR